MSFYSDALEGSSLQRYAILKLFYENPTRIFNRKEIQQFMCSDIYNKTLTIHGFTNPFLADTTDYVPTILIDRLKELCQKKYIELIKDKGKEKKYKLCRYNADESWEEYNFNENGFQDMLSLKKSLDSYSELPISQAIGILDKKYREYNDYKKEDKSHAIVDFDTPFKKNNEIIALIGDLYSWIDECAIIKEINYSGHYNPGKPPEKKTVKNFQPYILKESKGQWYLLGKTEDTENFITIPINRIDRKSNLNIKKNKAFERTNFDPKLYFDGCAGITKIGSPLTLKFKLKNGPVYNNIDYLIDNPIIKNHQEITDLKDGWIEVCLNKIYIGPELVRIIRSFGEKNVKDIHPYWFEEDLWEKEQRTDFLFSIELKEDINIWKEQSKKLLRIEKNNDNQNAIIDIKHIPNKKDWHEISLKNILINSVIYFYIDNLKQKRYKLKRIPEGF